MVFEYHNGPSDLPEVEHPDNILLENDLIDTEEFYDDYLDEETQDKQSIDDTPETIH
jgi:hypothetical protein